MPTKKSPRKPAKPRQPTKRQQAFIEALADPKTKSKTEAALKAGYAPNNAAQAAQDVLRNPYISEAVERRRLRAIAHANIRPDEVLGSAAFNMRGSIDDVLDEEGYLDLKKARENGAIDLVKELEIIETYNPVNKETSIKYKIKLESPAAARKEVAEYLGLKKEPAVNTNERDRQFEWFKQAITAIAFQHKCDEKTAAKSYLEHELGASINVELRGMLVEFYELEN